MNIVLLALAGVLAAPVLLNAQNLAPNPSFENYDFCPENFYEEVALSQDWNPFMGTSDYAHGCAGTVPDLPDGNISLDAHTGQAYMGFVTYFPQMNGNYREGIWAELDEPMVVGQNYFVSMYVVRFARFDGGSNNLGVRFSTVSFESPDAPLPNSAHVNHSDVITDSENWTRVAGSFIADSAYRYLAIGNFFDSAQTLQYNDYAYYFVDDICVSTDSTTCVAGTGTTSTDEMYTIVSMIHPNPAKEKVTVTLKDPGNKLYSLALYNIHGRQVLSLDDISGDHFEINRNGIESGIYFFQLRATDGELTSGKIHFE